MANIQDWDDAYANGAYIENADNYVALWNHQAAQYRHQMQTNNQSELNIPYGKHPRETLDIFKPTNIAHNAQAKGICIFIHGGYWLAFDKSTWSHLAKGAIDNGYYVVMPSYTLAPEASISQITQQMIKALTFIANRLPGNIYLAGHSAGGHLATRMACQNINIDHKIQSRIKHILSISGLHDLRPLLNTQMNQQFKMDLTNAIDESPALQSPIKSTCLTCAVGSNERPEFIRQTELLANIWTGLAQNTHKIKVTDKHHFNIIDALQYKQSHLTQLMTTGCF